MSAPVDDVLVVDDTIGERKAGSPFHWTGWGMRVLLLGGVGLDAGWCSDGGASARSSRVRARARKMTVSISCYWC